MFYLVFSVEIGTWMRVQWLKSHLDKMRDVGKLGEGLRRYGRVYICHFKERCVPTIYYYNLRVVLDP